MKSKAPEMIEVEWSPDPDPARITALLRLILNSNYSPTARASGESALGGTFPPRRSDHRTIGSGEADR